MLKADPSKHRYLTKLYRMSPELASLGRVARELFDMIRRRDSKAWPSWLDCRTVSVCSLRSTSPKRPECSDSRVATTLEQRHGRRSDPPVEADQKTDVRPRRLRFAQAARPASGLILGASDPTRKPRFVLHQKCTRTQIICQPTARSPVTHRTNRNSVSSLASGGCHRERYTAVSAPSRVRMRASEPRSRAA